MPNIPIFDGFTALPGGMNEARKPTLISETQFAKGINVAVRGGYASTRPAFVKEYVSNMPTNATFQGAGVWRLNSNDYIVFVASGRLYTVNVSTLQLVQHGEFFSATAQCFFEQVDKYMVAQDGNDDARVLEDIGGVPTLVASHDIPTGTIMKYAHGRIHMVPDVVPGTALNGKPYFLSGDVLSPLSPSNVLKFDENTYLNGGGAHSLPLEMGYINGLGVFRNAQTGTGLGELVVLGKRGVSAFDMSLPRDQWAEQPLSRVLFFGPGTLSPWSVIPVNDDLAYRALDGLRLIRYTASRVAGSSGSLSNTPMSREIHTFVERQDLDYLAFVSSTVFDNRLVFTVEGVDDRYFKGIASLDTAVLYDNSGTSSPSYDGIWTGLKVGQLYRVDDTAVRDEYAEAETWDDPEKEPTAEQLAALDDGVCEIESILVSRSLKGGDEYNRKLFKFVELWVSELKVSTEVEVLFRPVHYPLWTSLGTKDIAVGEGSLPQTRRKLRFSLDSFTNKCDPSIKESLWSAYSFQIMLKWKGNMEINSLRIVMEAVPEPNPNQCAAETAVVLDASDTAGIVVDDFEYVIGEGA